MSVSYFLLFTTVFLVVAVGTGVTSVSVLCNSKVMVEGGFDVGTDLDDTTSSYGSSDVAVSS